MRTQESVIGEDGGSSATVQTIFYPIPAAVMRLGALGGGADEDFGHLAGFELENHAAVNRAGDKGFAAHKVKFVEKQFPNLLNERVTKVCSGTDFSLLQADSWSCR